MLAHYRRLIALRHENRVVALGRFSMLLPDHDEVYAFTRSLGDEVLLVVCNVSRTPQPLAELLPEAVDAELVLGNLRGRRTDAAPLGGTGAARPVTEAGGDQSSSNSNPWWCSEGLVVHRVRDRHPRERQDDQQRDHPEDEPPRRVGESAHRGAHQFAAAAGAR